MSAVRFRPKAPYVCGYNSVVECNLAKVEVESSNLFARSKETPGILTDARGLFFMQYTLAYTFVIDFHSDKRKDSSATPKGYAQNLSMPLSTRANLLPLKQ